MLVPWRVLLFPSILWFNGKMAPFGDTSNLSATRVANFSLNHGRKSIFQKIHFFSLLNLTPKKHCKNIPHHRTTKKKNRVGLCHITGCHHGNLRASLNAISPREGRGLVVRLLTIIYKFYQILTWPMANLLNFLGLHI